MNTKSITIQGYTVTYPETMLVTTNPEKTILVATDHMGWDMLCLLEFSDGGVSIEDGWNTTYRIDGNRIHLMYIREPEDDE